MASLVADPAPGPALAAPPAWPARAPDLALDDPERSRPAFPRRLTTERDRARVLHAFANHELLALELMALTLLRFPDAPPAFRMGLARTMQDEQRHLGLYLERMRAAGVELGAEPLSGYFWSAMAGVDSPLDFVVRMSLTFEQANLDFALHWAGRFRAAGDAETAAVLERVRQDEIAHVGLGLSWFRRWRPDPGQDDWSAYRALLPPPLTPSRAKGPELDEDGRLQAGFQPEFLARLRVFSSSKGRPPVVHLWNPGCELELADGSPGAPLPAPVQALEADLAGSFAWLARRDDVVIVPRRPGQAWLGRMADLGWEPPELIEAPLEAAALDRALAGRELGGLRPWGWSPRVRAAAEPLLERISAGAGREQTAWVPDPRELRRLRELAGKPWSAARRPELRAALPALAPLLGPEWTEGVVAFDPAEVRRQAGRLAGLHPGWVLLKAPLGSSGRGAVRVAGDALEPAQEGWLRRTLQDQGAVVVEPWLERQVDLSVQLEVGPQGARAVGLTRFLVDRWGRFRGCLVAPAHTGLEPSLLRFLHGEGGPVAEAPLALLAQAGEWVGERLAAAGYRGPAGVDAFVYRLGGRLHLQPLVELNPRLTMGRLALALGERVQPGRVGLWAQLGPRQLQAAGWSTAQAAAEALERAAPPRRHAATGRLESGAVCTHDPASAATLGVLVVGAELGALERLLGPLSPPAAPASSAGPGA